VCDRLEGLEPLDACSCVRIDLTCQSRALLAQLQSVLSAPHETTVRSVALALQSQKRSLSRRQLLQQLLLTSFLLNLCSRSLLAQACALAASAHQLLLLLLLLSVGRGRAVRFPLRDPGEGLRFRV
jgi:hypothetical protein